MSRASFAKQGGNVPLLYLYGVTAAPASLAATLRGVDGVSKVDRLECSGFTCWISRVDAREFGENLNHNMENLEWLADASVRHQRVVGAIYEREQILPARFGTVFLNPESLSRDIDSRKAALKAGFKRIAGTDEWGVRIFALPRTVNVAAGAKSGREYLQRKSELLQTRPSRTLEPEIQEFAAAIAKLAAATAAGGKVSAGQPGLRWHASLLIPRSDRAQFENLLARTSRQWHGSFRIEATGPWPPYSFVGEDAQARGVAR
ncbi:MAG: GvpL/GvpF family gas vesicle protein [Terriglobales bacterium]